MSALFPHCYFNKTAKSQNVRKNPENPRSIRGPAFRRDLISAITRLASQRLCSPTPAQYAVRPALEGDKTFLADFIRELKRRRDFAVARARQIEGLSCTEPEAAFYLMLKADEQFRGGSAAGQSIHVAPRGDAAYVEDLLEVTGVLAVPGSGFGADPGDGYFRIVYLPNEAMLATVFNRIQAWHRHFACAPASRRHEARSIRV